MIELLVKAGDTVKAEQSLITVESDKASMEIPSSHAGVVKRTARAGGRQGQTEFGGAGARRRRRARPGSEQKTAPAPAGTSASSYQNRSARRGGSAGRRHPGACCGCRAVAEPRTSPARRTRRPAGYASPSVRKFARLLGVLLAEVQGSGPKGRISHEDDADLHQRVMAGSVADQGPRPPKAPGGRVAARAWAWAPWPKVDFAQFGPVERKELSHQEDQRRQPHATG